MGRRGKTLSEAEKATIKRLARDGLDLDDILREVGRGRKLIRAVLRDEYEPRFRNRPISDEERMRMVALRGQGLTSTDIGELVGRSPAAVRRVLATAGAEKGRVWDPSPYRLSAAEREHIRLGLHEAKSCAEIARQLGRHRSTIKREVDNNGGREGYEAWRATVRACRQAGRPRPLKLVACPRLAAQVTSWLEALWSPEEISRRLRIDFPDDPMMRVSHETIYTSLYVQGRGALRKELAKCLRSGRTERKPQGRLETRGKIPAMVMISARPPEVADRAVPGHWEGDLIIGANGASQVGTLVERATRYVLLLHLSDGRADTVAEAMKKAIKRLPAELFRTITWDQGKEMARHAQFSIDTGIQIYFCDPHSPWQRGSNENTNGLLRQYMPKGTDLSVHTPEALLRIEHSLNNRPRETLGFLKPSEKLAELFPGLLQ